MTKLDPCTQKILEDMFWQAFEDTVDIAGFGIDSGLRAYASGPPHNVSDMIALNKARLCASECERMRARLCAAQCAIYSILDALNRRPPLNSIDEDAFDDGHRKTKRHWASNRPKDCDDYSEEDLEEQSKSGAGNPRPKGLLCSP